MMKKVAFGVVLVIIGVVSAITVFMYGTWQRISVHSNYKHQADTSATPAPKVDAFHNGQPYDLLMLGYGGGGHEGGKLTDTMILARIVPKDSAVYLISLPRDMWVRLPSNGASPSAYWKINAAYAIGSDDRTYPRKPDQFKGPAGGGELAKYAVDEVTGITPDNFVTLDFAGFEKSIDVLKGVDVKVEKTFDDDLYPIEGKEADTCGKSPEEIQQISATLSATQIENMHLFPCRYEHLHFDAGLTHMDGATALKYVRSRHSSQDGGDFERAARQRNLLVAVKQRVLSLNFVPEIVPFMGSLGGDFQTDLEPSDLQDFLHYQLQLTTYTIHSIALTDKNVLVQTRSQNGQDILAPKAGIDQWDSVKAWLQDEMAREATMSATLSPSPSPSLTPKVGKIATRSGSLKK